MSTYNIVRSTYLPETNIPIYANTSDINTKLAISSKIVPSHTYSNVRANMSFVEPGVSYPYQSSNYLNRTSLSPCKQIPLDQKEISVDAHDGRRQPRLQSQCFDTSLSGQSDKYINRSTVQNVLNLQKKHWHMNLSHNQSISTQNQSINNNSFQKFHNPKQGVINSYVKENEGQNYDSGNCSGDRNSSSSNASVENPFLTIATSKGLLYGPRNRTCTPISKGTVPNPSAFGQNVSDHSYDSFVSGSGSDTFHSVNNSPGKPDAKIFGTQSQTIKKTQDSSVELDGNLKIVTEENYGPPDCDKLCAESDLLYSKSQEKEKEGDFAMAALLSDSAAARARAAMDAPYSNSKSLAAAKMKHNTCVMRSSYLYRKLRGHDSDDGMKPRSHHSRQSSRDSTHSRLSRHSSREGSLSRQRDAATLSEDLDNSNKSIDIYGTLPKKGCRKKSTNNKAKAEQVYKDFLLKQRENVVSPAPSDCTAQKTKADIPQLKASSKKTSKVQTNGNAMNAGLATVRSCQEPLPKQLSMNQTKPFKESSASVAEKKQHKIKRKLMGGFLRRKNKSLPDLRVEETSNDYEDITFAQLPSLPSPKEKSVQLSQSRLNNNGSKSSRPLHAFLKKSFMSNPIALKVCPPVVNATTTVPEITDKKTLTHAKNKMQKHELSPDRDSQSKIPLLSKLMCSKSHDVDLTKNLSSKLPVSPPKDLRNFSPLKLGKPKQSVLNPFSPKPPSINSCLQSQQTKNSLQHETDAFTPTKATKIISPLKPMKNLSLGPSLTNHCLQEVKNKKISPGSTAHLKDGRKADSVKLYSHTVDARDLPSPPPNPYLADVHSRRAPSPRKLMFPKDMRVSSLDKPYNHDDSDFMDLPPPPPNPHQREMSNRKTASFLENAATVNDYDDTDTTDFPPPPSDSFLAEILVEQKSTKSLIDAKTFSPAKAYDYDIDVMDLPPPPPNPCSSSRFPHTPTKVMLLKDGLNHSPSNNSATADDKCALPSRNLFLLEIQKKQQQILNKRSESSPKQTAQITPTCLTSSPRNERSPLQQNCQNSTPSNSRKFSSPAGAVQTNGFNSSSINQTLSKEATNCDKTAKCESNGNRNTRTPAEEMFMKPQLSNVSRKLSFDKLDAHIGRHEDEHVDAITYKSSFNHLTTSMKDETSVANHQPILHLPSDPPSYDSTMQRLESISGHPESVGEISESDKSPKKKTTPKKKCHFLR